MRQYILRSAGVQTILNKELTDGHIEQLLSSGRTKLIKGFKGKKGNSFDAMLVFDRGYNVTLVFPDRKIFKKEIGQ